MVLLAMMHKLAHGDTDFFLFFFGNFGLTSYVGHTKEVVIIRDGDNRSQFIMEEIAENIFSPKPD